MHAFCDAGYLLGNARIFLASSGFLTPFAIACFVAGCWIDLTHPRFLLSELLEAISQPTPRKE